MVSTKPISERCRFTLRRLLVVTAGMAMIAVVVGYVVRYPDRVRKLGRQRAESDWLERKAVLATGDQRVRYKGRDVTYFFDQGTGLELDSAYAGRQRYRDHYLEGYNTRLRELLREHGTPDWSRKDHIVDVKSMVSMLTSATMTEVTELPYELSDSITLLRQGSGRHGGSSTVDTLSIDTPYGFYGGGLENDPVYMERSDVYQDIVFIRVADYLVFALHTDGMMICLAEDNTAHDAAFLAATNSRSNEARP